ncbi:MAG: hypothetical protein ABIP39_09530 [Polyangiaceae bacterium]
MGPAVGGATGGPAVGAALTVGIGVGLSSYSGGGPFGIKGAPPQAPMNETTAREITSRTRRMA